MSNKPERKTSIVTILMWILAAYLLYVFLIAPQFEEKVTPVSYNELVNSVESGTTTKIHILSDQRTVVFDTQSGRMKTALPGSGISIADRAAGKGIEVVADSPPQDSILWILFLVFAPIVVLVWLIKKFMSGGNSGAGGKGGLFSFGKSTAKLIDPESNPVTLNDVISNPGEHTEATEVIDFLKDPGRFHKAGATFPRGILLSGPPGVGKTLLAKAIAGEAGVPFYTISGSEFVEMFVGVGASRVRSMFTEAKQHEAAIIFIDEIDAVGGSRGQGRAGGGHDEREQTLNQLLVEMDGFEKNSGILIIAATNRPDMLDSALLRPGRFDRTISCSLPDASAREKIIQLNLDKVAPEEGIDCEKLARGTTGFSGADLQKMINEAAIFTARDNRTFVSMDDLEKAKDKVMMGAECPKRMSDKEKVNTAYHEAGHAIIGYLSKDHDPVYKVSIIPRGHALGVTQYQPDEDSYSYSKAKLQSMVFSLLGGRAAEEITLGIDGVTTGASNDLDRATELIRNMITKWGFGNIGLMSVNTNTNGLGQVYSNSTGEKIDENIQAVLNNSYNQVMDLLRENRDKLDIMKDLLISRETIDSDDISSIMSGDFEIPTIDDSVCGTSISVDGDSELITK